MRRPDATCRSSTTPGRRRAFYACAAAIAALATAAIATPGAAAADETRQTILSPEILLDEKGEAIVGERGLILVPENRKNPDSRLIAVHFQRYPPINPGKDRPPVFLLPGGPGSDYKFTNQSRIDFLNRLRQTREVVAVSQRGNPSAPGLVPHLRAPSSAPAPLDKPGSVATAMKRNRADYDAALAAWKKAGVDVEGYDILNIVDDVNDLRAALGYDKIFLRGCSFGSQWSFSYLKRWPETVERAMLSGVEPLDYAYDSAKWLWASMARLAAQAEADPDLAPAIPEGGLMAALETVVERLETAPVTVGIINPQNGEEVDVVLGADDLRLGAIRYFGAFGKKTDTDNLALWPHFILDMYEGDYRALGLMAAFGRQDLSGGILIGPLIDNSLGISDARDEKLLNEAERRWIDPNWGYRATREVKAAPEVDDDFRADWRISTPVLLVSGDLDWSTPIENAEHAAQFLDLGKLVTVKGATHCPLGKEEQILAQDPDAVEKLHEFIDGDFKNDADLKAYFDGLPQAVALGPIDFAPRKDVTLYEVMLSRR